MSSTRTIIEAVCKRNGPKERRLTFFDLEKENSPMREAIQFYKQRHNWSNRMIAGDSREPVAYFSRARSVQQSVWKLLPRMGD